MGRVSASPSALPTFQGCVGQLSSEAQVNCRLSMFAMALSRACGSGHPKGFPQTQYNSKVLISPLTWHSEGNHRARTPRNPGLRQCGHSARPGETGNTSQALWGSELITWLVLHPGVQTPCFPMSPSCLPGTEAPEILSPNTLELPVWHRFETKIFQIMD